MLQTSYRAAALFLSHLSGDEVGGGCLATTLSFLSHLSGDEGLAI